MQVFNSAAYVAYASNAKTQSILCCCPNTASRNIGGGQGLGPQLIEVRAGDWFTGAGGIVLTFDRDVTLERKGSDESDITVTDMDDTVLIHFLYSNIDCDGVCQALRLNAGNSEILNEGQQYTLNIPSNTRIMDTNGVKIAGSRSSFTIPIAPPLPNLIGYNAGKWNAEKEFSLVFDTVVQFAPGYSTVEILENGNVIISFTGFAIDATDPNLLSLFNTDKTDDHPLIQGKVYTLEIPPDFIVGEGGFFAGATLDFCFDCLDF